MRFINFPIGSRCRRAGARPSFRQGPAAARPPCFSEPLERRLLLSVSLVKDLYPGQVFTNAGDFVNVGSTVYFTAGADLWKTDGTAQGTVVVESHTNFGPFGPEELVNFNGTLYFHAHDVSGNHDSLWKSDGTPQGAVVVADTLGDFENLTAVGTNLFFSAADPSGQTSLWVTDGTSPPRIVFQTGPGGNAAAAGGALVNLNGTLLFSGDDGTHGAELWRTDGTSSSLVADIQPGPNPSLPGSFFVYNGAAYFSADDGTHGNELWKSDGTAGGTTLVADINAGPNSSGPSGFAISNGLLFFHANTDAAGEELWVTDGTTAGTHMVRDINPGANSSDPTYLTDLNGKLLFQADDGTHGPELFIYDSKTDTLNLADINPGPTGSTPAFITRSGDLAYFGADDGTHGIELWQTDGTVAGTVLSADINPGPANSTPGSFTDINGTLYFSATDGADVDELWKASNKPTLVGIQAVENQNFSGVAGTFTDANPTRTTADFTATIEWGDGTTSMGTISQPGGAGTAFQVSGAHAYAEEGAFPVVLVVHNNVTNTDSRGDVNVSRMAGSQSEPTIAVDPTNPARLFAASNINDTGLFAAVSTDGGTTWATRVMASGSDGLPTAESDPQAKFDRFGNLFLTYLGKDAKTVVVALSTDAGQTFTSVGQFTSATDPAGVDQPSIATGPGTGGTGDAVWVAYKNSGDGRISAAGATVSGKGMVSAFSTPEEAPGSGVGNFGDVAVGPRGQVLITWQDNMSASNGFSTIFTNEDDDGLGPHGFNVAVPVTRTNVVGQYSVPPQATRTVDAEANLAWDRSGGPHSGRVYLSYTDSAGSGSPDTNIFITHSDDGGQTWSTPVRVNDDTGSATQFLPAIAVDQTTGDVGLSWYDTRNDPTGASYQVFAAISSDGGTTFSPNVRVSTGATNTALAADAFGRNNQAGDYSYAAFFGGAFHPIWVDNSALLPGNPDPPNLEIATAAIPIAQVADAALTASGTTIAAVQFAPFTGTVATFSDANPSPTVDDFTAAIDWGDGQFSQGTIAAATNGGGFTVTGTHTYGFSGPKTATVHIFDHGASVDATDAATVLASLLPQLSAPDVTQATTSETFTVTYTDAAAVRASTIGTGNVFVTGPNGVVLTPVSATVDDPTDGTPRVATYVVNAPNGTWGPADDGTYTVSLVADQVGNTRGNFAQPGPIGSFKVDVQTPAGSFGVVNGKRKPLKFTTPGGVAVTVSLTGGTGQAFTDPATGQVDLRLDGTGGGSALTVKSRGGRVPLGDVTVNGSLKSLTATAADLAGTLFATGAIGKLTLGNVTGGTIASAASIASLTAASLSGAKVLAGASLGADGALGGGDDSFAPASIGALKVNGAVTSSVVAAGIAPGPDGAFGTADDTSAGGGSVIKSLVARSADAASQFESDAFGKSIRLPKPVKVTADPRFRII